MKRYAFILLSLFLAVATFRPVLAGGASQSSGPVFLQPDDACPPAEFAIHGPCLTVLSTDPVVCGYPRLAYGIIPKSIRKKLDQAGYFVTLKYTVVGEACGQPLVRVKAIGPAVPPPCALPQECS